MGMGTSSYSHVLRVRLIQNVIAPESPIREQRTTATIRKAGTNKLDGSVPACHLPDVVRPFRALSTDRVGCRGGQPGTKSQDRQRTGQPADVLAPPTQSVVKGKAPQPLSTNQHCTYSSSPSDKALSMLVVGAPRPQPDSTQAPPGKAMPVCIPTCTHSQCGQ